MGNRILVVDDYRDTADTLARLIRALGHEATVAYGGLDALDQLADFEPDMVLLDIAMPGIDGLQTAAAIRQRFEAMILVAISGWCRDEDKRRAYAAGFDRHLSKPVELAELKDLLGWPSARPR
ncbi:MAG: response regulator [Pirellulaceae bacterium]|nr:response regulator [Pirellulaceae bacterium]